MKGNAVKTLSMEMEQLLIRTFLRKKKAAANQWWLTGQPMAFGGHVPKFCQLPQVVGD